MEASDDLEIVPSIVWTRQASSQIDSIYEFIASDNPAAALAEVSMVLAAVGRISSFPALGRPGRIALTRELVVPQTPHIIAHRLHETAYRLHETAIQILGIYYGAQR